MKTRELTEARTALAGGDFASALFLLQQSERVAVAQRKLDELVEVRELVGSLSARSSGEMKAKSERLAGRVAEGLHGFPADELRSFGIEPEPDPLGPVLAGWTQRPSAGDRLPMATPELAQAQAALEGGDAATTLFLLQQARRVAVAQQKPVASLEAHDLVQRLSERSSGPTRAASEQLALKIEDDLRSFARAGTL
jgi:hypothetical protein